MAKNRSKKSSYSKTREEAKEINPLPLFCRSVLVTRRFETLPICLTVIRIRLERNNECVRVRHDTGSQANLLRNNRQYLPYRSDKRVQEVLQKQGSDDDRYRSRTSHRAS